MKSIAHMHQHEGFPVLRLSGELDVIARAELDAALARFSQAGKHLVLDLRAVSHADSAALGLVVSLHCHASEHGGALAVVSVQTGVGRLLHVTGLASVLKLFDGLDEAAGFLASSLTPRLTELGTSAGQP